MNLIQGLQSNEPGEDKSHKDGEENEAKCKNVKSLFGEDIREGREIIVNPLNHVQMALLHRFFPWIFPALADLVTATFVGSSGSTIYCAMCLFVSWRISRHVRFSHRTLSFSFSPDGLVNSKSTSGGEPSHTMFVLYLQLIFVDFTLAKEYWKRNLLQVKKKEFQ